MGDVVDLHPVHLENDIAFVADLARYRENLLDEKAIRKKYRLAEREWESLGANDELIRKVEEESARRIRDGSCKREKSQQLITKAPGILDGIMSDPSASPRHRVDAIRTLDNFCANPGNAALAADRFIITINLGSDSLTFDKSRTPDPNDIDPFNDVDTGVIAIAARKPTEGGGGNNTL